MDNKFLSLWLKTWGLVKKLVGDVDVKEKGDLQTQIDNLKEQTDNIKIPTIPNIGNGTITIKQNGVRKGSFTTNQSGNAEIELTDNNTTYGDATTSEHGLMSAADKAKLNNVAENANNYSLPAATSSTRGGVKTGYTQNGKNYPVQVDNEQMYVNVPWTQSVTSVNGKVGNVTIEVPTKMSELKNDNNYVTETALHSETGSKLTAILNANTDTVTFSDEKITSTSIIDIYTDVFGISPTDCTINGSTLTVTFDAQDTDVRVLVVVRKEK